jgi:hypothetical protein
MQYLDFLFSQPSEAKAKAIGKVDDLLELYMGIRDIDLGKTVNENFRAVYK